MSYKMRPRGPKRERAVDTNSTLFEYAPPGEAKEVITFTKHDSIQLQSPNYLNDTIISFFMQYHLDNFVGEDLKKKIHIFSSFFLSKIKSVYTKQTNETTVSNGNSKISTTTNGSNNSINNCASRWLKGVKIFEKDFLLLPVCEDDHWLLVIVCYPRRTANPNAQSIPDEELMEPAVFVLNSMKAPAAGVKKALQKFLAAQWTIENKSERSFAINNAKSNGIRLLFPEVPQQKNNYNCGVYVLNYFKCFLKSPRESYIRMFRQRSLLNWFDENEIRVQNERMRMVEIVRKQNKLWATPEKLAKRAEMDSESQKSLDSQRSEESQRSRESQSSIIEIN